MVNLERAHEIMRSKGIDALVAFSSSNVFYLTGYHSMLAILSKTPSNFAVLPREGEPVLVMATDEEGLYITSDEPKVPTHRFHGKPFGNASQKPKDEGDPFKLMAESLKAAGAARGTIGYDGKIAPEFQIEILKKKLPKAKFVEATNVFQRLRMVKSEDEVRRLRKSLEILEGGYMAALKQVREGMSENEFVYEFKRAILTKAAESTFLQLETGFGSRGGLGGGTFPSDYRAKRGDVIHFDAGVLYRQYCSDICRDAVLGEASDTARRLHDACFKTQEKVIDMLRPGTELSDAYRAALKSLRDAGFPEYVASYFGHSIGLEAHEWPSIEENSDVILQENMVIQVEIPFYDPKIGAFNPEDCILITKDGPEYVSSLERNLFEL